MKKINIRNLTVTAIMGGAGFILMLLEIPLPFIIPNFIKLDFSELPALITAFSLGPLYGVLVCFIKNLIHLFISTSLGVGELSNFLLGAIFCFFAGSIYKTKKNRKYALIGCLTGSFIMGALSILSNFYIVYPMYVNIYGMPIDVIIGMYKALLPYSDTLIKSLVIFNFPFTFFKGVIDSVFCFLIYKKLSPILKSK